MVSDRAIRKELERKVDSLEIELEETRQHINSNVELKASIYLLQDNIGRQAYLKHMLHKD